MNSFAARKTSKELREGKSPASWFTAALSAAAAENPQAEIATLSRPCGNKNSLNDFLPLGRRAFLSGFLDLR